jgi:hypothetical protein
MPVLTRAMARAARLAAPAEIPLAARAAEVLGREATPDGRVLSSRIRRSRSPSVPASSPPAVLTDQMDRRVVSYLNKFDRKEILESADELLVLKVLVSTHPEHRASLPRSFQVVSQ